MFFHDTLLMRYTKPVVDSKKKKKKGDEVEEPVPVPQFNWSANISSTIELNGVIRIEAPAPVASFDSTRGGAVPEARIRLKHALKIQFRKDPKAWRERTTFYTTGSPKQKYTFSIDSAALLGCLRHFEHEAVKKLPGKGRGLLRFYRL